MEDTKLLADASALSIYVSWLITALVGAFGIGVGYAVLRSDLSAFKHEFRIYKDTAAAACAAATVIASEQLTNVKERVNKVESKMEYQVGYDRCHDMRDECNNRIALQLAELSKQVNLNRDAVIAQMRETEKFIGRVEQFMLKNGSKT